MKDIIKSGCSNCLWVSGAFFRSPDGGGGGILLRLEQGCSCAYLGPEM